MQYIRQKRGYNAPSDAPSELPSQVCRGNGSELAKEGFPRLIKNTFSAGGASEDMNQREPELSDTHATAVAQSCRQSGVALNVSCSAEDPSPHTATHSSPEISPTPFSETSTDEAPASAYTTTPTSGGSNANQWTPSKPRVVVAADCFVEPASELPAAVKQEWNRTVHRRLYEAIYRSLPEADFTVECVMARTTENGQPKPTVLVMYSEKAHKKLIRKSVRNYDIVPYHFERKVVLLDIERCGSGDGETHDNQLRVDIAVGNAHEESILFGSLVRIYNEKDVDTPAFSSVGGVISIEGIKYGLTTAHAIRTRNIQRQRTPESTGFTSLGHVEVAEWACRSESNCLELDESDSTAPDWALVNLRCKGLVYNRFKPPGSSEIQCVAGYVKSRDLVAGKVLIYAGVSGFQQGFLGGHSASIGMAGSIFNVRSVWLQHSLVDGDSGSWVIRDGKLCGYIFSRIGKGMKWGHMLPIEPVFDAIAAYWLRHHKKTIYPSLEIRSDATDAVEGALDEGSQQTTPPSQNFLSKLEFDKKESDKRQPSNSLFLQSDNTRKDAEPQSMKHSPEGPMRPIPQTQWVLGDSRKNPSHAEHASSGTPHQQPQESASSDSQSPSATRLSGPASQQPESASSGSSLPNSGLQYDPAKKKYYRLTPKPGGGGTRTYEEPDQHGSTVPPPRTPSKNNPLAIPQGANIRQARSTGDSARPSQPVSPLLARRPSGRDEGSSISGLPPQPSGARMQPTQYSHGGQVSESSQRLPSDFGRLSVSDTRPNATIADSRPARPAIGTTGYQSLEGRPSYQGNQSGYLAGYSQITQTPASVPTSRGYRQTTYPQGPPTSVSSTGGYPSHTQPYANPYPSSAPGFYDPQATGSPYATPSPYTYAGSLYATPSAYASPQPPGPNRGAGQPYLHPTLGPAPIPLTPSSGPTFDITNPSLTPGRQPGQGSPLAGRYRNDPSTVGEETVDENISEELVRGTEGTVEGLDPNFQVVRNHWAFFVVGRVFMMLSWQPHGHGKTAGQQNNSVKKYSEEAFAKIYRYVVVRARPKQGYSMCLRISTHGGRATVSKLLAQNEHSIIYTGKTPPSKLPEERKLNKDPIQVIPIDSSQKLDPLSRIHFAKPYPVEHNVKVREVGMVALHDHRKLVGFYKIESGYDTERETPREPERRPKRESAAQAGREVGGNSRREPPRDTRRHH